MCIGISDAAIFNKHTDCNNEDQVCYKPLNLLQASRKEFQDTSGLQPFFNRGKKDRNSSIKNVLTQYIKPLHSWPKVFIQYLWRDKSECMVWFLKISHLVLLIAKWYTAIKTSHDYSKLFYFQTRLIPSSNHWVSSKLINRALSLSYWPFQSLLFFAAFHRGRTLNKPQTQLARELTRTLRITKIY